MNIIDFLYTKQDYLNMVELVQKNGEDRQLFVERLREMRNSITMMNLKAESWVKRAETQHQEDYEPVPDPNCELYRLGFSVEEIDGLIEVLSNA